MRKRRKIFGVLLLITAILIMQLPVTEADAAASASDFQINGSTLVKYTGTDSSVSIPATVEKIGKSAFEGNTAVTSITIPDSVKKIEEYAFWGCSRLESVRLGSGLKAIGDYSFANCKGLKSMTIPSNINTIGIQAFADCVNMTDITIPPEVTDIHDTAFDGCYRLTIHAERGSVADRYAESFVEKQAEMPEYEDVEDYNPQDGINDTGVEGVTSANGNDGNTGEQAAGDNGQTVPPQSQDAGTTLGTTQVVGNRAVVFLDNMSPQVVQGENPGGTSTEGEAVGEPPLQDALEEEQNGTVSDRFLGEKGENLPKYTIVDGTKVADQAYYRNKEQTQKVLPDGIREIGQFSFARSVLTSVVLPEGTETVGYGAFYHCDDLKSVTIPESVMNVEPKAFSYTAWVEQFLKNGTGGNGDFLISGGVLTAYRGNSQTVSIPEGVRVIAAEVFADHGEINSVTLPDSLLVIGEGAFSGCGSLSEITGGSYVTRIKDRAFSGCPVKNVRITDTVESIGLGAFDYAGGVQSEFRSAVFHGKTLPAAGNEISSGRLSNEAYRTPALNGVMFAVIDPEVTKEMLADTVLHSEMAPFEGVIGSIEKDMFKCRYSNLTENELQNLTLPELAYIYGTYYEVVNADGIESLAEDEINPEPGFIQITGMVGGAFAELEGAVHGYVLRIEEAADTGVMENAFQRIYHTALPAGNIIYEITLKDGETKVPITRLGRQKLTVTMPVPDTLAGQELRVLTTDRNGQLESVPCELVSEEQGYSISFGTYHLSPFCIYGKGTMYAEAAVKDGTAVVSGYGVKDDSPDTGDLLHPKWYLGFGLLFASAALLLSGSRNKGRRIFIRK